MKNIKLLSTVLFFVLTFFCSKTMSQEKFVNYQEFELAYKETQNLNILSQKFDLLTLLLLDSSHKQKIFKFNSELEELYRHYSNGLSINESTVGFVTQTCDIENLLSSEVLINKFLSCICDIVTLQELTPKISYPIYVKNNTAVVEIIVNENSDIYFLRLNKGVLQINWLGGTI
jgi:hypothetical protein